MSRSDLDYLKHIVDEGRYFIDASATLNRESFLIDETAKRAFARSIEVIGEASKKLSVDFREEHSEMDWRAMAGMRDVLIHAYFGVDDEIVWDVASKEIPGLVSRLANLINRIGIWFERMRLWLSVFVVGLALGGCVSDAPFTEADQQRVTAEVDSMLHAYLNAMREGGLEAEFAYLDSTDAFFWVPPGYKSWISYDSVEAVLRATAPTLRSMDYRWESLRIDPISQDRAIYTGTLSGVLTDTSGQATILSMIETGTVIRREDGWKLLNGQSAVLPVEE